MMLFTCPQTGQLEEHKPTESGPGWVRKSHYVSFTAHAVQNISLQFFGRDSEVTIDAWFISYD